MPNEKCNFSLNTVLGCLFAIGGESMEVDESENKGSVSTCECYSPDTGTWKIVKPIPGYRTEHAGATCGRFLFVSGGRNKNTVLSSMYCYNAEKDAWEQKAPMLTPRAGHVMLVMGQCLYICGGWSKNAATRKRTLLNTIDVYDITTDQWKVAAYIPTLRYQGGIVGVDNKIYFIGGLDSDARFNRAAGMLILFIKFNIFTAKSHISVE